jgi:lipopolysaccharide export system protein LptC
MSERAQRWLLWILALVVVAGTAVALRFARGYRAVAGRRNNRPAWTVRADRVDTTRSHDQVDFAGNVLAKLLLPDGKPRATITAPFASYTDYNKTLTATDKIVILVHSVAANVKDDLRVETEKVKWNVGARQVECPGSVRASLNASHVTGSSLTVDLKTRAFSLHHFNAILSLDDAPGAVLPLGDLVR